MSGISRGRIIGQQRLGLFEWFYEIDAKMQLEVEFMDKATSFDPATADEAGDVRTAVSECIQRIDLAREQITHDQAEIDQLQHETRAILECLRVALPAA